MTIQIHIETIIYAPEVKINPVAGVVTVWRFNKIIYKPIGIISAASSINVGYQFIVHAKERVWHQLVVK